MTQHVATPEVGDSLPFYLTEPHQHHQGGWYSHFQVSPEMLSWVEVSSLDEPFIWLFLRQPYVILPVCFGQWSCWKATLWPNLRFWALWTRQALMCLSPRDFRRATLPEGCSDDVLSGTFSHLHTDKQKLSLSDLWALGLLSHSSPLITQFGQIASSGKSSTCPKLRPFKVCRGQCGFRNHECSRNSFVFLPRSAPFHNCVSELFRQAFDPHDSLSYTDSYVPFLTTSNQFNETQLKV